MNKILVLISVAVLTVSSCKPSGSANNDQGEIVLTSSSIPENNAVISAAETLVFNFSGSLETTSFELLLDGQVFAGISTQWSDQNTRLMVAPNTHWPSGINLVSVGLVDTSGTSFTSETYEVVVNLTLDIDQEVTSIFGERYAGSGYYGNPFMNSDFILISASSYDFLAFYNEIPSTRDSRPDATIGRIEFPDEGSIGFKPLDSPQSAYIYNDQLFVVNENENANSVYIYNNIPEENEDNFGIALGRDNIWSVPGSGCAQNRLDSPEAVFAVDQKLLVADEGNSRVLIWNSIPTESGTLPDLVIGQVDFDTCGDDSTRTLMSGPSGIWSNGTKLLVADSYNNRVLGWNSFPTTNGQPADFVIGQDDFIDHACNRSASQTSDSLCSPNSVFSNGKQIFIADSSNQRVLVWNEWPVTNGESADIVIGQESFTVAENVDEDNRFGFPTGVFVYDDHLLVSDQGLNKIVVFNGK